MAPRTIVFLVVVALAALVGGAAAAPSSVPDQPLEDRAKELVDHLAEGEFEDVVRAFDEKMLAGLTTARLGALWEQLEAKVGDYRGRTSALASNLGGFEAVAVTCLFRRASVDVRVVFAADRRLAGLAFVPTPRPVADHPPDYAPRSTFTERDATVDAGGWPLPGTLTLPSGAGPFPAVVLVHGSGPNDRDAALGPNKPFRDLAFGLAAKGVAVLRYDKRTRVHFKRCLESLAGMTVQSETVDDALAAAALLRRTPTVDPKRIFVLGHGLGGTLAPRMAARDPGLAGLVLLAAGARPLEDALVDQVQHLADVGGAEAATPEAVAQRAELKAQAARIKALTAADAGSATPVLLGACATCWLDLKGYDPAAAAAALPTSLPLLLLQGTRDYQTTVADWKLWGRALKGRPGVSTKCYPGLNHLFFAGEGPSTLTELLQQHNVDASVVEEVAAWVAKH